MSTAFATLPFSAKFVFRQPSEETLPSVAGEIPRGAMTEIAGPASSGRTSLLYSMLAEASAKQEFCALLDVDNRFDPASAAAAGVLLSQVLWIRCNGNVEHALKSADMLAQAGGFGLVAVDLSDTPEPAVRRIPMPAWFRLRLAVENTRTALLIVARQTHARSCSACKIELRRDRTLWQGEAPAVLLNGFEVDCIGTRNHHQHQIHFSIPR